MNVEPTPDFGQEAAPFEGRVIGYADTQAQVDAIVEALESAGYAEEKISVLAGEDGIQILNRTLKEFFFGDGEDQSLIMGLDELRHGHFVVEVEVDSRRQAVDVANTSAPHGGRTFTYFGTLMNEQLT